MASIRRRNAAGALAAAVVLAAGAWVLFSPAAAAPAGVPSDGDQARVPIIMYHSVVDDSSATGEHVITKRQFVSDMDWIAANGYTPVWIQDVVRYAREPGFELPEKPVVITFDDGFYNTWSVVLPVMREKGFRFTVCIVGSYADKETEGAFSQAVAYSYCNWSQIKDLSDSGLVETADHTYSMHKLGPRRGSLKKAGESAGEYEKAFKGDVEKNESLISTVTGSGCSVFSYPYGFYSKEAEKMLAEMGFDATLLCEERINLIARGGSTSGLGRFNRYSGPSSESFFTRAGM